MHSVPRSQEPDVLRDFRGSGAKWDDLRGTDRRQIRDVLRGDFKAICAYCEQPCQLPTLSHTSPSEETVDHFRPRDRFPERQLDWRNLVYSCYKCNNQNKGNKWPGYDEADLNQWLGQWYPKYTPISEYVSPNEGDSNRPASDFFDFDALTGEIKPAEQLSPTEWSVALRTIRDIDLNDDKLGETDPNHLLRRRQSQRDMLIQQINALDDSDEKVSLMFDFTMPDKPFSTYIHAYLMDRFPLFAQLFHRR